MFTFFQNLRIGPRLAVGFGTLAAFMLAILTVGLIGYSSINQSLQTIVDKDWRTSQIVGELVRLHNENARNSFGAILTTDPVVSARYYEILLGNRKALNEKYAEVEKLLYTDKAKQLLADMREARKGYVATADKVAKLIEEKRREEAFRFMAEERLPALEKVMIAVQALKDYQDKVVDASGNAAFASYQTARNQMIGLGLIALLLGSVFAYLIARHIARTTGRLQDTVQRVAGGDYSARSNLETGDELGTLGRAFDEMLNERVASLAQKERESEAVNSSLIEVMRAVSRLARGDLTVKAPVREDITGALADAINSMSESTARTLSGVAGVSHEVRAASQQGRDTVLSTAKGMNEIRGSIQETGKRIKRLGERSQEITGIVKLIDDIAERTSVLALNANMQAAMAGEAGRGFRVVADEVQRLAERSKEATDQISKLVTNIQSETNDTMATMDRAIGEVVKGGELAEKAAAQVTHLDDLGGTLLDSVQAFTLPEELVKESQVAANRDTGRRAA